MTLFVDTSVWSLAFRRDGLTDSPEVDALRSAATGSDLIVTTGIVVQELLQGSIREATRARVLDAFDGLATVTLRREDHVAAAGLWSTCRRAGVQLGTVDALIAQLCVTYRLTLLTTDRDLLQAARHCELAVWAAPGG